MSTFMSTTTLPLAAFRTRATSLLRDYAELTKLRVTSLIVMTAWCGYFFGAHQAGVSWISWGLFHSLFGIGLVSSGTAALNEVMEHVVDEAAVLDELRRVLGPKGVLVVISPNRWFPYECHGVHVGTWRYKKPAPLVPWLPRAISDHMLAARNYWPRELAGLVREAGFDLEQLGFVWPVLELDEYKELAKVAP